MLLARGASGELRAGYAVAARLSRWQVARPEGIMGDGWVCQAEVESRDDYLLAHGGALDLWLVIHSRWWVWRSVQVRIANAAQITGNGGPTVV